MIRRRTGRWGRRLGGSALALAAAAVLAPAVGRAQEAPPTAPDTTRRPAVARPDSVRKDSLAVRFDQPDSVMRSLMEREGYVVTRYESARAQFDADTRALALLADSSRMATVQRGTQGVVSDSGVYYQEGASRIDVTGRYLLSDPSSGQADILGRGSAQYDVARRTARITNPRFTFDNGTWHVGARTAVVIAGDTSEANGPAFYAAGGILTSCQDSVPHFHFEYREAKRSSDNTLVARPAVLYIRDIPVMWLPFIFQDTRRGRRSGILTPRFGVSDIVRNSVHYRRNVEGFGYYFAMNDYMDAAVSLDWRSGAGGTDQDPGWMRYNAEWHYNWLNRFLHGRMGASYNAQNDGQTNLAVSWNHNQKFSSRSSFTANMNYVTSTQLQRQNTFNPYAALATISSQATYQQRLGPVSMSLGGQRSQYPGRDQVLQTFPTFNLTSQPISPAEWLVWTPSLSYSASQVLRMDSPGTFMWRYSELPGGGRDSVRLVRNQHSSQASFGTPLQIFGYNLSNTFRMSQQRRDYPEEVDVLDVATGERLGTRVYANTYSTNLDWTPAFQLPAVARNRFNLSPNVSLANVDPRHPFWVSNERTGGDFIAQSKRPTVGLSASPTVFGLIPGIGVFSRFRHAISPTLSYSVAPKGHVSDEFLLATGQTRRGYLAGLPQSAITLGLSQNLEAKVRTPGDTSDADAEKLKLVSMQFTPLSYDFERARSPLVSNTAWWRGLTTERFGYNLSSDLLPGFRVDVDYSLFEGSTMSDTARFDPYRERISATFDFSREQNPLAVLGRLFGGRGAPAGPVAPAVGDRPEDAMMRELATQPVGGTQSRSAPQYVMPPSQGWRASFTFSSARYRPPVGGRVIDFDPEEYCRRTTGGLPFAFESCLAQQRQTPTLETPPDGPAGGPVYRLPASMSLGSNLSFALTPKWSAGWQTSYDFERREFASHMVNLQRDMHDWRAIFAFTQSPNGNFAFNFSIALKAQSDIKFDYNRATVGQGTPF